MTDKPIKIFIIAGEASGDNLGAGLMRELKVQHSKVEFHGIGGTTMQAEGLHSLFPMQELSVMGIAEVLPKLFGILKRINQSVEEITKVKPDVVITIDSPDFCFRVIKKLKKINSVIPCVHYVAPSVWAWRPGRAYKVAQFLDHLLALLPFEPPYFEKHGLQTTFVGHPIATHIIDQIAVQKFKDTYALNNQQNIITLLPGSRMSEIKKLLPLFMQVAKTLQQQNKDTVLLLPTLPHLRSYIENYLTSKNFKAIIIDTPQDKFSAFVVSKAAIAASGTVSLELALTKIPHVIAYKLNYISSLLAKFLVKTPYANLVNILLGREIIPELVQEKCTHEKIVSAMDKLLLDQDQQRTAFVEALSMLGMGEAQSPDMKAATAVLKVIASKQS